MIQNLKLKSLTESDCQVIANAFENQGSKDKTILLYQRYLKEESNGLRDIIVATFNDVFAGYVTIQWEAGYTPFKENSIPEIVDFNVLKKFQRIGIGSALMDEAESRIKKVANKSGIGFGIFGDYGAAQILYIRRGYVPDGRGIVKDSIPVQFGEEVTIDHSLALYLTKEL